MMWITRPIGIDLGTTTSGVAMLDLNEGEIILWKDQGRSVMPSCVWCDPRSGEIIVGHRAYSRRGARPEPVTSIKRSMGTQMKVTLGKRECTPAEVSACILKELKTQMQAELEKRATPGIHHEISRAIITVPAYFGLPAIESTREAGQMAGLQVMELLHEPTAAAIYYSWKHNLGDGLYLVYDLGGGTLDVSVLRRISGEFQVLGISGDNFLGGDDFDRKLAEYLRKLLVEDGYEMDLDLAGNADDRLRFNQLVTLAERAKKELSTQEEITFRDQSLRDKSGQAVVLETNLTRQTFEDLIAPLLDHSIECCQDALAKAQEKGGVTLADIDYILLVGGSTYIPAVVNKVQSALCCSGSITTGRARCAVPIRDEPEIAVTLGAALRAAASGVGLGDDQHRICLWLRSTGATRRQQTAISGQVEMLQPGLDLEGGKLRLMSGAGALLDEVPLKPGLRFTFQAVDLQAESINAFQFELLDAQGQSVALLQRSIVQSKQQKEAVGRVLSTAVLSKSIILEGTDGDRLVHQVLLEAGHSLPATARFNFSVADAGGHIRLPIYQENRIIKELRADVGAIQAGTPVDVEITCDEQVHIQVRFSIGSQSFGGKIEPPPPDAVPSEYEVQQIEQRFQQAINPLEPEVSARLSTGFARLRQELDDARDGADYPKVIQRAADLEGLFREARLATPLEPHISEVEKNYTACLELLPKVAEKNSKVAVKAIQQDLEKALEAARQAYQKRERQAYGDLAQGIHATLTYLSGMIRVNVDDQNMDVAVRAVTAVDQLQQLMQFLMFSCLFGGHQDTLPQVMGHMEEVKRLEARVDADPVGVLTRCQVLFTEGRRLYQLINPEEKRNLDIDGLLKVGGQAYSGGLDMTKGLFKGGQ
jgi:molecular chaperone DnaK